MAHFARKHKPEGLAIAAKNHILNHLEFGACLLNYVALNQRYDKLRRLEDVDDFDISSGQGGLPSLRKDVRIRFVNYYTLSTGRPKNPATSVRPRSPDSARRGSGTHLRPGTASTPTSGRTSFDENSRLSTPRISVEDYSDSGRIEMLQTISLDGPLPCSVGGATSSPPDVQGQEPSKLPEIPERESPKSPPVSQGGNGNSPSAKEETSPAPDQDTLANLNLPPIPDMPEPPSLPDLSRFTNKDSYKQAEKEGKRAQKNYEQAVKDREKAIKERQKLVERQRKKAQKEVEKQVKEEEKKRKQEAAAQKKIEQAKQAKQKETQSRTQQEQKRLEENGDEDELKQRLRQQKQTSRPPPEKELKFCTLPRKTNGVRDPAWVEIHMEGVDEVGAHCGLFFAGPHYERLIGDVGSRIAGWVHNDASKRAILALAQMGDLDDPGARG